MNDATVAAAQSQIRKWGLPQSAVVAARLAVLPTARAISRSMADRACIVIPYWTPTGAPLMYPVRGGEAPFARVRWLAPKTQVVPGFVKPRVVRYGQPAHSGVQVYWTPLVDWPTVAADPSTPILITEGEAKALHAAAYSIAALAVGGVYSFAAPSGDLHPDLQGIVWTNRDVWICYDSDAVTNPAVTTAEARLVDALQHRRGARCHVVRLPQEGDGKVGLDDYILAHGIQAFVELLQRTPRLDTVAARVIAMNRRYAWIDREAMIYDLDQRMLMKKADFTLGSMASTETVLVMGAAHGKPKAVQVASAWLKHPHAKRYAEVLFRPGEGSVVTSDHGTALNLYDGWREAEGDVTPWLRLTDYLFQLQDPDMRDFPLKLLAYKAQNPAVKVPLALVLVGSQGSGKTMWAEAVREAFRPYGASVTPAMIAGQFHDWLETSLVATVQEMTAEVMHEHSEMIKSLVSDLERPMNVKFRPSRTVNSYTLYIFTTNLRGVGSFSNDDRRMIVLDCPGHGPKDLYTDMLAWSAAGGSMALMHYLLTYDLQGWTPPQMAPLTPEKAMAAAEGRTMVQEIVDQMQHATQNFIVSWLDSSAQWAATMEMSNNPADQALGRAVAESVKDFTVRPWYTPDELAMLFPALASSVMGRAAKNFSPGKLSRELREAGIRFLRNKDDPRGFVRRGRIVQYLVIANMNDWLAPISQADMDRYLASAPTYAQIKAQMAKVAK